VVWCDLTDPDEAVLAAIRDELGLHNLAIEDALQARQRPKVDRYEGSLFAAVYSVDVDRRTGSLTAHEVGVFVTPRAIITVHSGKDNGFDIDEVVARWDGSRDLAKYGVAFLLHGLLDYVVDSHFEAAQALEEGIEALEDRLFDESTSDTTVQRRSFALRKSLVGVRRYLLPMREVAGTLLRGDFPITDEHMVPYYQDVYDHVLRAAEQTDSLRDMVSTMLETRLTVRGNRLNVITKQVTSWAAIIAVPTAITGFYGQNVPYPGFQQASGFWTSTALILAMSGGLYLIFRRKGWL
jgi:magnesium transporter